MALAAALSLTGAIVCARAAESGQHPKKAHTSSAKNAETLVPLAAGTTFNATLTDTLDSQKSRAGDSVTAEIDEDVRYGRSLVLPKGTKLAGHITETSSQTKGAEVSVLAIEFDKALLKNGKEALLNAGVQAIAGQGAPDAQPPGDTIEGATEAKMDYSGDEAGGFQLRTTDYGRRPNQQLVTLAQRTQIPRGTVAADGSMTPDCRGAFGMPGVNLFTSTKLGAEGTLLLRAQGEVVLNKGTKLLVVVQPPAESGQQ